MTTEAPARCCAPATSGRCSNAPAPHGQSRYIGPVEIAACNQPKHQAALRSLPGFTRRDGVCGADGCGKPIPLGLCPEHRHLYQRHGVSIRALLATEPTMSDPVPEAPPPAALAVPHRVGLDRLIGRLMGLGFVQIKSDDVRVERLEHPRGGVVEVPSMAGGLTIEEHDRIMDGAIKLCEAMEAAATSPDDAEPSVSDVAEAAAEVEAATVDSPFPGRWGQQHSALTEGPPARGHEPTAPGPTMADMQARVIAAEQRADRAELDAVSERARGDLLGEDAATQRARAEAAEQQLAAVTADRYERLLDDMTQSRDGALNELHEVGHALYLLGSDSDATAYEALCQILPPDRLVDLRRVEEALAAAEVARVRCRRGSAEALADAIAAHASTVARLTEAERAAGVAS